MKKNLTFDELLAEKGIADGASFLDGFDDDAPVRPIRSPLVELRGSVQLMLKRVIGRTEVSSRMSRLRHV